MASGRLILPLIVLASVEPGFTARQRRQAPIPTLPARSAFRKYLFHIPWACSVVYNQDLIGACTIIDFGRVLVSVDNFMDTVPNEPSKQYYQVIDTIYVNAGSNYMDSTKLSSKQNRFVQTKQAYVLWVVFKNPKGPTGTWQFKANPPDISPKAGAEFDAYGLAFDVGILVLSEPFTQSNYVLPMKVAGPFEPEKTDAFKNKLMSSGEARTHSCITYSWNQELNKIRYHEVTYLPDFNCADVFCDWRLLTCQQFPRRDYLICFKSVKYADVCPNARGAALYCPHFNNSVLGILTTAPSCGQRHMPGVYTTLPMVIEFYEKALSSKDPDGNEYPVKFEPEKIVKPYNLYSLPQLNADYSGVL